MIVRHALTEELKLGEDNSDPIKVHPELNRISSPRPCVRALAARNFTGCINSRLYDCTRLPRNEGNSMGETDKGLTKDKVFARTGNRAYDAANAKYAIH